MPIANVRFGWTAGTAEAGGRPRKFAKFAKFALIRAGGRGQSVQEVTKVALAHARAGERGRGRDGAGIIEMRMSHCPAGTTAWL